MCTVYWGILLLYLKIFDFKPRIYINFIIIFVFLEWIVLFYLYILYKLFQLFSGPVVDKPLPKLKKQDISLEQLHKYDGTDENGRVCVAVNGKVFDVTRGKRFYGPGNCIRIYIF